MGLLETLDPEALDREAPVPLYHQLRRLLLAPVENGHWRTGDPIPTEREICETYQVSRITVRRAIEMLVREGYLVTYQGKGTFVARQKIQRQLNQVRSFSEEMQATGHRPGSRLLSLRHEKAVGDVAAALNVDDEEWIWTVERLRLADGEPMGVSTAYLRLPADVYLTPQELQHNVSLWNLLRSKGIRLASSEVTIQAIAADEREAELLQVLPASPLLLVEALVYSDDDIPIEYDEMINRGDRYKYITRFGR